MDRATAFEIMRKRDIIRNMELEKLKAGLEQMEDPRRTNGGHILHKLEDIIIIGLCTVVCGGEDFPDMEEFGKEREEWLRKFLELPHGIPDSDTFRRVFERIKPEALSECLYDWLGYHRKEDSVIAVDGKTIRGSKGASHKAYHVVSAFAAENQLVLSEIVTDEKSNEITAVPELLDSLNIENSIVTADAMSCQKEIIRRIRAGKADYVIGLKGNQPALLAGQQHLKSAEKDIKKAQRIQSGGKALFLDTDPAAKVSILAERQSSFTQDIQVERGHIFTGPGAILVKDNIQTPVQLILYGPMLAYRIGKMFHVSDGREEISGICCSFTTPADRGSHHTGSLQSVPFCPLRQPGQIG